MKKRFFEILLVLVSIGFVSYIAYGKLEVFFKEKAALEQIKKMRAEDQDEIVKSKNQDAGEEATQPVAKEGVAPKKTVVRVKREARPEKTVEIVESARPVEHREPSKKKQMTLQDAKEVLEDVRDGKDAVQGIFGL